MTRLPAQTDARTGARRIAAVDARTDAVRLLVVETGRIVTVVETRRLDAGDDQGLVQAIRDARATLVVHVVPAHQCVCRLVEAPLTGTDDDLPALALLAETQLPDTIPAHRRAAGVIPAPDRSMAQVLLTGWPAAADAHAPPIRVEQRWVGAPACLAMLAGAHPGLACRLDQQSGAIAIVAHADNRTLVRTLLADNHDDATWEQAVRQALQETAAAAGLEPVAIDTFDAIHLPAGALADLSEQVAGMSRSPEWLDDEALALGAALCCVAPARTASLTSLHPDPPTLHEPAHRRLATWISRPANARLVTVAALLLILLAPLALAWARLAILDAKSAQLEARQAELEQVRRHAALYRQLEQSRWPMTKLLADVSGATPVGITAEAVRISTRQGLRFEGTAASDELIVAFQKNLASTHVFRNVRIDTTDATDPGAVGFAISADVASPLTPAPPVEDFAEVTLAQRLYGPEADNTAFEPSGAPTSRRASRPPTRRDSVDADRADRADGGDRPDTAGARPAPSDDPLPEVLTDDQIDAMQRMDAVKAKFARRVYIQKNPGLDAPTKARLEDEMRRIDAHLAAGGGA